MRCPSCDYPLWNLPRRNCPECGEPFTPSEVEFVPNSVAFCCPHCDQAYYGTTDNGHIEPREFDCVKCQKHIHMDEMILRPAQGVREEQTKPDVMPWLERKSLGFFSAFFKTVSMALVRPGALMRATPIDAPAGAAWAFACLVQIAILTVAMTPMLVMMGLLAASTGPAGGGPGTMGIVIVLLSTMLGGFVFLLIGIGVWGLVTHGILRLTGPLDASIGRTWTSLCYASGANVLTAVPCIGQYFGWIWWIVSACIATSAAHRVSGIRATMAVATGPFVLLVAGISLYAWAIAMAIGAAGTVGPTGTVGGAVAAEAGTMPVATVLDQTLASGVAGPRFHPLELLENPTLDSNDFIALETFTTTSDATLGGGFTLADYALMEPDEQRLVRIALEGAIPPDATAVRCGDVVFTYFGIDPAAAPGDLWLMTMTPDPAVNPPAHRETTMITVHTVDGSVLVFEHSEFAGAMEAQNELRSELGMAPLPDLRLVPHVE